MANSTSLLVVTVATLAASALAQISVPSREYGTFTLTAIRFDDQLDDNYAVATCNDLSSVYLEHRCNNESEPKSNIRSNTKAKGKGTEKWTDHFLNFLFSLQFGENLAAGYKNFTAAVDGWYNEERLYNYK
ncbi:hypothetical protein BGX24_004637 [Mortierella sp. AD032]|nr:hypothetical protein BGX24_004637 [Mortierella sp. AD032]